MTGAGKALMGIGRGFGPTRAVDAAMAAVSSPLLDFPIAEVRRLPPPSPEPPRPSPPNSLPPSTQISLKSPSLAPGPLPTPPSSFARRPPRAFLAQPGCLLAVLTAALSPRQAKGVVFTITGNSDMSLSEVNEVATLISEMVSDEANIIFGTSVDETFGDEISVTLVATSLPGGGREAAPISQPAVIEARSRPAASSPYYKAR
jgi:cell division GTPase FtsZ